MLISLDETFCSHGHGEHFPVMLEASIACLNTNGGGLFLDGTFGGGGHSRALLESSSDVCVVAVDQDPDAEKRAAVLKDQYGDRFLFYPMNFSNIGQIKEKNFQGALFDFGLSSFQLNQGERGFSFRFDGPLDMRMNNTEGITAHEFLESVDEMELVRAIRDFGEEPSWRRVVEAILKARGSGRLSRTKSFAQLVESAIPKRGFQRNRIHPATRSFQGVRIAINRELEAIELGLKEAFKYLKVGGVMVAISFHSLEDRIVKRFFRKLSGRPEHKKDRRFQEERNVLAKMTSAKAIKASNEEISVNPKSRSARMRSLVKLFEGEIS